jgi:hypothetical protein
MDFGIPGFGDLVIGHLEFGDWNLTLFVPQLSKKNCGTRVLHEIPQSQNQQYD